MGQAVRDTTKTTCSSGNGSAIHLEIKQLLNEQYILSFIKNKINFG